MSKEKLPEAPARYDKADQDRTRRLIERALSQPAAAGTIEITQVTREVVALVRSQTIVSTGTIAAGDEESGTIQLGTPSQLLITFKADTRCWVRFYATSAARDADASRARDTDPQAGQGCLGEFIISSDFVSVEFKVAPVIFLYNADTVVDDVMYYKITNDSGVNAAIQLTLGLISQETAL